MSSAHAIEESKRRRRGRHVRETYESTKRNSRYVPALDGLRAFAVLAVIVYHMGLGWAPGGLMGVTVFFVISGYLINGLLVAERDQTGSISLKAFWMRRVRRLFPAILLAVVGTAALCALFDHTLLDKMRPDILPSLLFYNNWWQIFRDMSYFEAAGAPSPLQHFWSLSIEEQFYVVWPLLLLLMYKLRMNKAIMAAFALVLAVASGVEMALLYDPHADPSRIYYGTDTRAMSLLVGVWLSFALPSAIFGRDPGIDRRDRFTWVVVNVVGIAAFVGLVGLVGFTSGFSAFPYQGGIALTSVLSALLIVVLVVPDTWLSRVFALAPLVWIGKRSYGMYLWHFPILLVTTDVNSTMGVPWWMRIVQVVLIFVVSALSYTFVEDPIRRGRLGAWWKARKDKGNPDGKVRASGVVPACCFAALLVVAGVGVAGVQPTDYANVYAGLVQDAARAAGTQDGETASGEGAARSSEQAAAESVDASAPVSPDASASQPASGEQSEGGIGSSQSIRGSITSSSGREQAQAGAVFNVVPTSNGAASQSSASASASVSAAAPASASPAVRTAGGFDDIFGKQRLNAAGQPVFEPLLIGDSVSLGAEAEFYRVFPYGHMDSVVSRNVWENPYALYRDAGQVGDYVVLCLGTNNAVADWQIDDEMLGPIEPTKKVFVVNTRNVRDWMAGTNA